MEAHFFKTGAVFLFFRFRNFTRERRGNERLETKQVFASPGEKEQFREPFARFLHARIVDGVGGGDLKRLQIACHGLVLVSFHLFEKFCFVNESLVIIEIRRDRRLEDDRYDVGVRLRDRTGYARYARAGLFVKVIGLLIRSAHFKALEEKVGRAFLERRDFLEQFQLAGDKGEPLQFLRVPGGIRDSRKGKIIFSRDVGQIGKLLPRQCDVLVVKFFLYAELDVLFMVFERFSMKYFSTACAMPSSSARRSATAIFCGRSCLKMPTAKSSYDWPIWPMARVVHSEMENFMTFE